MHTGKSLNSKELPVFYTVRYMGMRPVWYFHLIHLVIATIWDNHLIKHDQLSESCVIYSKIIFTTLLLSPLLQLFDLLSRKYHWRPLKKVLGSSKWHVAATGSAWPAEQHKPQHTSSPAKISNSEQHTHMQKYLLFPALKLSQITFPHASFLCFTSLHNSH